MTSNKRVFGLDVMRAVAVSLVVLGHFLQHAKPPEWIRFFGGLGVMGVEIFFVLSGFLIGGIIIDLIEQNRFNSSRDIFEFWSRRWLRTLPLYYLFFFIYLRFDWTGPSRLADHLDFLVFLQNFAWPGPDFFLLSWSLTIEEYFYLLFPLLFFLLEKLNKSPRRNLKFSLGVFLIAPLVIKFFRAPYPEWEIFNFNLRMVVIARLDSLMYGVAAVFVKTYHPHLWQILRKQVLFGALLFFAVCSYYYAGSPWIGGSRLIQTFIFPVGSLSVALLLPFFDEIRIQTNAWWRRLITYISTISYSIYLGHILMITIVGWAVEALPNGTTQILPYPTRLYPLYFVAILLFTPITYYGWERPFMLLRDRKGSRRKESSL